jgi:hypothetical protein
MNPLRNRRALLLIAFIAICTAVLLLLIPQAQANHAAPWLAFLAVFFVGLLTPFSIGRPLVYLDRASVPSEPCRLSRFQRPPPILLG